MSATTFRQRRSRLLTVLTSVCLPGALLPPGALLFTAVLLMPGDMHRVGAADWSLRGNPELAAFFDAEVDRIEQRDSLLQYRTLSEWEAAKPLLRCQLFGMLGLNPLPERTPLQAQVTGTVTEAEFRVEKLHFQSLPGLYVTANLYLPLRTSGPVPAVLYVCGHAQVKHDGVSLGNKTHYQHHGAWYERNGYACLTIDSLQLGEIEGIHHGTYRFNRWWWNARGYTPAGVEAWNCIRALDFLQSRPDIDGSRLGVTGRSGGGAYSWWISALDERIQCAVPVAGITTLRNHVVDGCVEGHCDCMYLVNTHRWDYARVAALVAPRPLLISNTDKDRIFPLEGVVEIHRQVRHIYDLYEKPRQLGLQITEGPHEDTQELHLHAFRWMNRFLKHDESLIEKTAVPFFRPEQLQVLTEQPADQKNTRIDDFFVPAASLPDEQDVVRILHDQEQWFQQAEAVLRRECFAAWPDSEAGGRDSVAEAAARRPTDDEHLPRIARVERIPATTQAAGLPPGLVVTRIHYESQPHVPLLLDLLHPDITPPQALTSVHCRIVADEDWDDRQSLIAGGDGGAEVSSAERGLAEKIRTWISAPGAAVAVVAPRGFGPQRWNGDASNSVRHFDCGGIVCA